MNEQSGIAIVKEVYGAFARGDIAGILDRLTEDVAWNMPGEPGIPFAGKRRGTAAVAEFFQVLNETDEVLAFEPREFFANGAKVVVLGHYRARARATGRTVDNEWVHVFTVQHGKLASWTEFCDTAAISAAYRSEASAAR
jgi:ketosteroid isomerase-like protein